MHEGMKLQPAPHEGHMERPRRPRGPDDRRVAITGLLIGTAVLLATVPACSSSSTPTAASTTSSAPVTSTTSSVVFPEGSAAEVADCESDAKTLETALAAYQAETGAYPSPSAWSAAAYAANFEPLTAAAHGGPFLPKPPSTKFYVIEYDSAGHIWIAPAGAYGARYNAGQDFDAHPDICQAAVG